MTDAHSTISDESLLNLDDEFSLGLKFFREKEGKAFHLKYADRLKLCAYVKQIKYGPFDSKNAPDVGLLDVVGSNRKESWRSLGEMKTQEAEKAFLELLDRSCPLWAPFLEAHRREAEEKERQRQEEERRRKEAEAAAEAKAQQEAASWAQALSAADAQRRMIQEAQIRAALNQQTIDQFRQYAEQQHPNNKTKQEELIRQLQEQHFQQYITQVYRQQLQRQRVQYPKPGRPVSEEGNGGLASLNGATTGSVSDSQSITDRADFMPKENGFDYPAAVVDGHLTSGTNSSGPPTHPSELPPLAAASMWTRKDVQDFKATLAGDKEGMLTVGSGECVTIRVPTHDEGTFISWEFATDSYDIGFGLYFEWTHASSSDMTVHVSRGNSDDEEDDDDVEMAEEAENVEKTSKDSHEAQAVKKSSSATNHTSPETKNASNGGQTKEDEGPIVDEIVPIYRRDCQNEVYCGSHQYPGRGVYLLKFDNSYSLWRSKSLYYRVFYTR